MGFAGMYGVPTTLPIAAKRANTTPHAPSAWDVFSTGTTTTTIIRLCKRKGDAAIVETRRLGKGLDFAVDTVVRELHRLSQKISSSMLDRF